MKSMIYYDWDLLSKDTNKDRGSTAQYTVYTVYTVNTVQTALHCWNSSMYAYILLGKV